MHSQIKDEEELFKIHSKGHGFILNDYPQDRYRILHHASCDDITRSSTTYKKFFFSTREEAFRWLESNRGKEGEKWHCCGHCDALGQNDIESISKNSLEISKKNINNQKPGNLKSISNNVFKESKVQEILVNYLKNKKYNVKEGHRVKSGLIDVVADKDDELIIIEAKGEDKGGYTSAEMNFMIGIGQIITRMTSKNAKYALAFPLTNDFKKVLRKYKNSDGFSKLGLNFYVVSENEMVSFFNPEEFLNFIEEL